MIRFCYIIHSRIFGVYISIQRKSKRQAPFLTVSMLEGVGSGIFLIDFSLTYKH